MQFCSWIPTFWRTIPFSVLNCVVTGIGLVIVQVTRKVFMGLNERVKERNPDRATGKR
jgi:MFS superfamily sulfate permease-like transporter